MDNNIESIELLADVLRDFLKEPLSSAYVDVISPEFFNLAKRLEDVVVSQSKIRGSLEEGFDNVPESVKPLIEDVRSDNIRLLDAIEFFSKEQVAVIDNLKLSILDAGLKNQEAILESIGSFRNDLEDKVFSSRKDFVLLQGEIVKAINESKETHILKEKRKVIYFGVISALLAINIVVSVAVFLH